MLSRQFQKNVKIVGTNSTSPLASTKASKNELKTNSKRTPNEAENRPFKTRNWTNEANPHSFSLRQPMAKDPRPRRELKKDVKIVGTNSISHLESIKVAKNEAKTNPK
jgi:hypothetical protein